MRDLPLLATMGVGSYATPGWLFHFRAGMRQGVAGPEDIDEAFEDATRIAIGDQIDAGVDVISDGELRRMRFVYEMYDRLGGIERTSAPRRLGVPGYDRAPHFTAAERIEAPAGLGIVREFERLRELCPDHPLKIAFPGPVTFARNIAPGAHYGTGGGAALMDDLIAIVREIISLNRGLGRPDDIDHLGNRRVRTVGELIQNSFRIGLLRMERVIRERMTITDPQETAPSQLINIRPVAIDEPYLLPKHSSAKEIKALQRARGSHPVEDAGEP